MLPRRRSIISRKDSGISSSGFSSSLPGIADGLLDKYVVSGDKDLMPSSSPNNTSLLHSQIDRLKEDFSSSNSNSSVTSASFGSDNNVGDIDSGNNASAGDGTGVLKQKSRSNSDFGSFKEYKNPGSISGQSPGGLGGPGPGSGLVGAENRFLPWMSRSRKDLNSSYVVFDRRNTVASIGSSIDEDSKKRSSFSSFMSSSVPSSSMEIATTNDASSFIPAAATTGEEESASVDKDLSINALVENQLFDNSTSVSDLAKTPSIWCVRMLMDAFWEQSKEKVIKLLAIGLHSDSFSGSLDAVFRDDVDPAFNNVIKAIGNASFRFLPEIVSSMLNWTEKRHLPSEQMRERIWESASKTSLKEGVLLVEELYHQGVEYIFLSVMQSILEHISHDNLDDNLSSQLAATFIGNISKVQEKRQGSQDRHILSNRKKIIDKYAEVLGIFSKRKLRFVTSKIFRELLWPATSNNNRVKVVSILRGLRFLRLDLERRQESTAFIRKYADLFQHDALKKSGREVRDALFETLTYMLKYLASDNFFDLYLFNSSIRGTQETSLDPVFSKEELVHKDFFAVFHDLWDKVSLKTKKSRDIAVVFPLMAAILGISDMEFFNKHFWPFFEGLTKLKDRYSRPLALQCVRSLVEMFLRRVGNQKESEILTKLEEITDFVFAFGPHFKKVGILAPESTDVYVDIICFVAHYRIDYAVKNIILELLTSQDLHTSLDRCNVAWRAVFRILSEFSEVEEEEKNNNTVSKTTSSSLLSSMSKKSGKNLNMSGIANVNESSGDIGSFLPFVEDISVSLSSVLVNLDGIIGGLLLSAHWKSPEEVIERYAPQMSLFRLVLQIIPIIFPAKFSDTDLADLLCKYLIHLDEEVRNRTFDVMKALVESRDSIRHILISRIARFSLYMANQRNSLVLSMLKNLELLMALWIDLAEKQKDLAEADKFNARKENGRKDSSNSSLGLGMIGSYQRNVDTSASLEALPEESCTPVFEFDVVYIESALIVFLCSPHTRIRSKCMKIFHFSRKLHGIICALKDRNLLPETRVMDVIEETAPDIFSRLQRKDVFGVTVEKANVIAGAVLKSSSFEQLVTGKTKQDQIFWTMVLGELARNLFLLCKPVVIKAWDQIMLLIQKIEIDDAMSKSTSNFLADDQMNNLMWWRNGVVFSCVTITRFESKYKEKKKLGSGPTCARELILMLSNHIKKNSLPIFRDAAIMALERCNRDALEILFDVLKPYEQFEGGRGFIGKKKRVVTRNAVSMIRSYICNNLGPGNLVQNENLLKIFLQNITDYMHLFSSNDYIYDNLLYSRYNFCIVVRYVAREIHEEGMPDSLNSFDISTMWRELFNLFRKWTQAGVSLFEEQTRKRMNSEIRNSMTFPELLARTHYLQCAACSSMGSLLLEPIDVPVDDVFSWVDSILLREHQQVRPEAESLFRSIVVVSLEQYLRGNCADNPKCIPKVIEHCYSSHRKVSKGYFLAFCEFAKDNDFLSFPDAVPVLVNLILLRAGDKSLKIRQNSVQLLLLLKSRTYVESQEGNCLMGVYPTAIDSGIPETYETTPRKLSESLVFADSTTKDTVNAVLDEFMAKISVVSLMERKIMTNYIIPWIRCIDISCFGSVETEIFLKKYILATMWHCNEYPDHIFNMWSTLSERENNVARILDFVIDIGVKKGMGFVPMGKRICLHVASVQPQKAVDFLVRKLSSVIAHLAGSEAAKEIENAERILEDPLAQETIDKFEEFLPRDPEMQQLTRVHLSLLFLSELAFSLGDEFKIHLPVILQLIFLGFDYPNLPVYEHCRVLLLNLVYSLVIQKLESTNTDHESLEYFEALDLWNFLKAKDNSAKQNPEEVAMSEAELYNFVKEVVDVLLDNDKSSLDKWADEALVWALSCPIKQQAIRSHQIYRALIPEVATQALVDTIFCLERTVTDSSQYSSNLIYIEETLLTLQLMVERIQHSKLILFPSSFWVAVSFLYADCERHFVIAIRILKLFMKRFNFGDRAIQNIFLTCFPKKSFQKLFVGIQPLIVRGLFSADTYLECIDMISEISLTTCDEIFHFDGNLFVMNLLLLIPFLYEKIEDGSKGGAIAMEVVKKVLYACEMRKYGDLVKGIEEYVRYVDGNGIEFLRHICHPLAEVFEQTGNFVYALSVLFGLVDMPSIYGDGLRNFLLAFLDLVDPNILADSREFFSSIPQLFNVLFSQLQLTDVKHNEHQFSNCALEWLIHLGEIGEKWMDSAEFAVPASSSFVATHEERKYFSNDSTEGAAMISAVLKEILSEHSTSGRLHLALPGAQKVFEKFFSFKPAKSSKSIMGDGAATQGSMFDISFDGLYSQAETEDDDFVGLGAELKEQQAQPLSQLNNFPAFQGFEDLLEGIEEMVPEKDENDTTTNNNTNTNTNTNTNANASNNTPLRKSPLELIPPIPISNRAVSPVRDLANSLKTIKPIPISSIVDNNEHVSEEKVKKDRQDRQDEKVSISKAKAVEGLPALPPVPFSLEENGHLNTEATNSSSTGNTINSSSISITYSSEGVNRIGSKLVSAKRRWGRHYKDEKTNNIFDIFSLASDVVIAATEDYESLREKMTEMLVCQVSDFEKVISMENADSSWFETPDFLEDHNFLEAKYRELVERIPNFGDSFLSKRQIQITFFQEKIEHYFFQHDVISKIIENWPQYENQKKISANSKSEPIRHLCLLQCHLLGMLSVMCDLYLVFVDIFPSVEKEMIRKKAEIESCIIRNRHIANSLKGWKRHRHTYAGRGVP